MSQRARCEKRQYMANLPGSFPSAARLPNIMAGSFGRGPSMASCSSGWKPTVSKTANSLVMERMRIIACKGLCR